MKNKLFYSLAAIVLSVVIYSCEDFIEVDLGRKSITVLAPVNNAVSSNYNQLFKWEELKGAEEYQLQIVKPSFSAIQQFVLDTNTALTQFSYVLLPGSYQWRLRALNNSSQTEYQVFNLTIDSTLDLSFSILPLFLPSDNKYSKMMTNTFTWGTLPYADTYTLKILSGTTPIYDQSYTGTTGSHTFTAEGTYFWKVYAQNSTSTSGFTTRTIIIDTTRPFVPTPTFPILDTITANPIPLQWNTSTSADSSHLIISAINDSIFALTPLKDTMIEKTSTTLTYNFYSAVVGAKYFWKVQDVDHAGNKSSYFTRRRIKRN